MAASAHFFPKFEQTQLGQKTVNLTSDTLTALLIASGTLTWGAGPEGYEFVSDYLANGGSALTEVTGGGYARVNLTSVSYTVSGEVVTLTSANIVWSSVTFTAVYAMIYDSSVGVADASHPIIAHFDFGGSQTITSGTFTLVPNASGLVTWTGS